MSDTADTNITRSTMQCNHSLNILHQSAKSAVPLFAKPQGSLLMKVSVVQVDGVLQERC